MLFVPRQVALASSHPPAAAAPAVMAKEESKKEKKSKSKAAAKAGSAAAAAPEARAVVVASVAAFLEAGGFPRALAALQSEADLEEGSWKSSAVSLEDLVSKFLESSSSAPVTATVGNNEQDEANEAVNDAAAPSAVLEDETGEKKKKKKKKKVSAEASEPESKSIETSAEEKTSENAGAETKEKKHKKKKKDDTSAGEAKETVKSDDPKVDGKKKKSKKQEEDDDVEARLEKASLAIQNKLETTEKLKEDGGDGALDKTKKKKKGKSEKVVGSVAAQGDGAKAQTDCHETVKDDNEKKAKKKRKKSDSEENVQEEAKDNDQDKSALEIEDGENGKPSSENAVVGKKRKLEEVEESKPPATENGTANETLSNGFSEDNSKENSTISKPSNRQKKSAEPKTVTPFQRVKLEAVKFADERLQDNSYWAKGGAEIGYGAKAQEILGQVRGRGFRHEKTKKKRGAYRGGQIDLGTHSIKFENSDDE